MKSFIIKSATVLAGLTIGIASLAPQAALGATTGFKVASDGTVSYHPCDVNGDGAVNVLDMQFIGTFVTPIPDANGDGVRNGFDYVICKALASSRKAPRTPPRRGSGAPERADRKSALSSCARVAGPTVGLREL